MRRREFITLVAGVAATLPLAARAQEAGRHYRLGFLVPVARRSAAVDAMFDEFRRNGFVEGQNLTVIGSFGVTSEQIADAVSAVVMVSEGLVVSLAKPGGNITGISLLSPELDDKRQDILVDAVPGIRRMAALADLSITQKRHLQQQQEVARSRGVELSIFSYAKADDIAPALDEAKAWGAEAVNFLASPMQLISRGLIFDRMMALRLPAIYQWPDMAEEGGLMGYGPGFLQVSRQRARQVVKILRGVKPTDLPVEQPSKFELAINLRTAKEGRARAHLNGGPKRCH